MKNATIKRNAKKNGIEIYFPAIPEKEIRDALKDHGFRWSNYSKCWYSKNTEDAFDFANSIGIFSENTGDKKDCLSLWERVQTKDIPAYGSENEMKKEAQEYTRINGSSFDKEAAKIIRAHLRKRFPECKFSVTSGGAGYLNSCDIRICKAPYAKDSEEIAAILNYCKKLHDAFDADDGDVYADYGAHHDLYGYASISYDFIQTPETEESREEVEQFEKAKKANDDSENARRLAEIEEMTKQREEEERERAEREKEISAAVSEIENAAFVEEYAESESFFVNAYEFRKLGTLEALEEYKREYGAPRVLCKVVRSVTMPAEQLLKFRNLLFSDFSFLAGQGGSGTNDPRINSADDLNKMSYEEQKTVEWFCICTAIKCKESGDIAFLVNPEGYNYVRYIYIIDGGRIPDPPSHDGDKISEIVDMIEDASTNAIDSLHMAGSGDWMKSHDYYKIMAPILDVITPEIIQHITIEPLKNWLYDAMQKKNFNDNLLSVLEIGRDITIVKDNLKIACGEIFSISFDDDENVKLSLVKSSKYLFNAIISYKDELSIYDGEISFDLSMIHNISDARNFAKITGHDAIF